MTWHEEERWDAVACNVSLHVGELVEVYLDEADQEAFDQEIEARKHRPPMGFAPPAPKRRKRLRRAA